MTVFVILRGATHIQRAAGAARPFVVPAGAWDLPRASPPMLRRCPSAALSVDRFHPWRSSLSGEPAYSVAFITFTVSV